MSLLESVVSPAAVRALPAEQLPALCAELRSVIIKTCGTVGGHLGASLGAVELIVALHRVFRTPVDRLVFDVGHQAYAHKLLTGRLARMPTLRQADGVAPFLDPRESEHDAFAAGHACTAVSVAVGLREGLTRTGAAGHVVAIVGDGALTGGLSFEGLHHAATLGGGLTVVLNDNGMSISKNVGAVAQMLRTDARRFFEALGFVYVGPIDGHELTSLIACLRSVRESSKPVVVHCRTEKGRGFAPAELDRQTRGHAMGPYDWRDGKLVRARQGRTTWSEAFAALLAERMATDARLVVITPAMIEGSALNELQTRFPDRVFDVGIAEQHAVTFAAGLAAAGLRPVVCVYSTFLQRAYDQLVHDVALPGLPVIFAIDRAGLVGADGATHQGAFDSGFIRPLPGFSLTAPVFSDDLEPLFEHALARAAPSAIRFPRGVVTAPRPPAISRTGTRWLSRVSDPELVFITAGPIGLQAVEAARNRNYAVLDAFDLCALDEPTIADAAPALIVVEEASTRGGLGDAVLEALARARRSPKIELVGLPHRFVPHGEAHAQRRELGLDADGLRARADALVAT